jgi:hypothetical protein|tara:strand:- start:2888 stop:3067 length:180 start_codon:yes stop_codon:yes gene_type:complete
MNWILTIYSPLGAKKFQLNGISCEKLIEHFESIGRITHDIPYTYFDGVLMFAYSCGVAT